MPLGRSSTLSEWLAHPVGQEVLFETLRTSPSGDLTPMLASEETLSMIGSVPLTRLAVMLGDAMGPGVVDQLLAEVSAR